MNVMMRIVVPGRTTVTRSYLFKKRSIHLVLGGSFLFLVLMFASIDAHADQIVPSHRVTSSVQIREAPFGGSSSVVGQLRPHQTATLIEAVPYYFHIQTQDGTRGFVSKAWTRRIPSGSSQSINTQGQNLSIHFLDVGQGDSTLLVCPNGNTMLVDAGSTGSGSPVLTRNYLVSVLEPLGLNINYLIVTHPDADHYNWLDEVLDQIPVETAFYVGDEDDYADRSVLQWIRNVPTNTYQLTSDNTDPQETPNAKINCGAADAWFLAAALEAPGSRKNAMSIVLMIRYGDFEAILTGDATRATENTILDRYSADWLDVDVLKIGHHGSLATSTGTRWADTLKPQIAVASAGYENSHGHPRLEVISRLTPHTIDLQPHPVRTATRRASGGRQYNFQTQESEIEGIFTTSTNGNVVITSDGVGFDVAVDQGRSLDE